MPLEHYDICINESWKDVFVRTLRKTLSIARACDRALIDRVTVLKVRKSDPEFGQAVLNAIEDACDDIEEALKKRAVRGWLKPIYWQGKRVGYERKFDTVAAMFLLRGRRKEIFGDAKSIVTINNQAEGSATKEAINDKKLNLMSPEELQKTWEDRCKAK